MSRSFSHMLAVGGKTNSLGLAEEAVQIVLANASRLEELYRCLFEPDAWVRMRAADALEKVCRQHPEWLTPYIDRFFTELGDNPQASIQWHLAQIFGQVTLTTSQRMRTIDWLTQKLQTTETDWIVTANCMKTLAQFTQVGHYPKEELISLLQIQRGHHAKSVVRLAGKLLTELQ